MCVCMGTGMFLFPQNLCSATEITFKTAGFLSKLRHCRLLDHCSTFHYSYFSVTFMPPSFPNSNNSPTSGKLLFTNPVNQLCSKQLSALPFCTETRRTSIRMALPYLLSFPSVSPCSDKSQSELVHALPAPWLECPQLSLGEDLPKQSLFPFHFQID